MFCQKPQCEKDSSETYTGKHGNTLKLCEKHYYELVSGKKVSEGLTTPSTPLGVGTGLTTQFDEPEVRGVRDRLDSGVNEYTNTTKDDVRILEAQY